MPTQKEEQKKNKRFPFSEAELLKGMTAHTAHADEVVRIAHYDDEELPNSANNDAC